MRVASLWMLRSSFAGWNLPGIVLLMSILEFLWNRTWVAVPQCGRVGCVFWARTWYKAPIALHQISLCQSSICLWICLESILNSSICSWLSYHLTIYSLSMSLPWAHPLPVKFHPLSNLHKLSPRKTRQKRGKEEGDLARRWHSGPRCVWGGPTKPSYRTWGESMWPSQRHIVPQAVWWLHR